MNDIKNMMTPKGDSPRASLRRLLKLNGGAFGKLDDDMKGRMLGVTRRRHGNETHGTKSS